MLSVGGLTPSIAAAATTTAVASRPKDAAPLSTGFATFVAVAVVVFVVGGGRGSGDGVTATMAAAAAQAPPL